jgi:hypothetical protein
MSDRAGKALAEATLPGEPRTYDARSKRSGVPLSTLYYREHGRRSKEEKAQGQQYLTLSVVLAYLSQGVYSEALIQNRRDRLATLSVNHECFCS